MDPRGEIIAGGVDRSGSFAAGGGDRRQAPEQKDCGNDGNANRGLAHPSGTAAVMPTEFPLRTP